MHALVSCVTVAGKGMSITPGGSCHVAPHKYTQTQYTAAPPLLACMISVSVGVTCYALTRAYLK